MVYIQEIQGQSPIFHSGIRQKKHQVVRPLPQNVDKASLDGLTVAANEHAPPDTSEVEFISHRQLLASKDLANRHSLNAPSKMMLDFIRRGHPQDDRRSRQLLRHATAGTDAKFLRQLAHIQLVQIVFLRRDIGIAEAEKYAKRQRRREKPSDNGVKDLILHPFPPAW